MKLLVLSLGMALSQEPELLRLHSGYNGASVSMAATNIQREDAPGGQPSPYASVVHLKGNVEIRTCCVQRPASRKKSARQYMVLRADEADYNDKTGEIAARGNVRVTFESPK